MHIFVSICSYRDPLLHKTIKSLMQEKSKRHKCTYSIFEQTAYNDSLEKKYPEFANHPDVIYKRIDPQYSDGCVWARYINLMNIRECHDFVYQVDSHMLFDKNWDMFLVEDYNMAAKIAGHDKVIITGACKEFSIDETGAEVKTIPEFPMTTYVKYYMINRNTLIPGAHGDPYPVTEEPKEGFHILAGNFFTHREWIDNVGLVPASYFDCEEVLMSMMSFVAGYNIFHHTQTKCYHLGDTRDYPTKQTYEPVVPAHRQAENKKIAEAYWKKYLKSLDKSVLERFREKFGVDFINIKIEDRARTTSIKGDDDLLSDDDLEYFEMISKIRSEPIIELAKPKKKKIKGLKPRVVAIPINSLDLNTKEESNAVTS